LDTIYGSIVLWLDCWGIRKKVKRWKRRTDT